MKISKSNSHSYSKDPESNLIRCPKLIGLGTRRWVKRPFEYISMGPRGDDNDSVVAPGKVRPVAEEMPLVHKVVVPPKGSIVKDIRHGVRETFFYDAPLRQFKGQKGRAKSLLGLQFLFPILEWGSKYTPKKFLGDLLAGLTIASLAVPQVHILCVSRGWEYGGSCSILASLNIGLSYSAVTRFKHSSCNSSLKPVDSNAVTSVPKFITLWVQLPLVANHS